MTRLTTGPFKGMARNHFQVILADPAWHFATRSPKGRGRSPDGIKANGDFRHYGTMSLDAIKALPVADLCAPDCALLMWAIDPMLPQAFDVAAAWGFRYSTVGFYWIKTGKGAEYLTAPDPAAFPMGTGYWTRANPEQCLLFTRGAPKRQSRSVRRLMVSPRREHSRKPDETHGRIMDLLPGPYLELFARQRRNGWRTWGNQQERFEKVGRGAK